MENPEKTGEGETGVSTETPDTIKPGEAMKEGLTEIEGKLFNKLDGKETKEIAEKPGKESSTPKAPVVDPEKEKKAKAKEISKKGSEATPEEKEEVADYILDRFKDKKDPGREVAKSYFYAEKVITKQGQAIAEAKAKINDLTQRLEELKAKGLDTGKVGNELDETLEEYSDLVSQGSTGDGPKDTRTETERLIDATLDKKLAPIYKEKAIQETLRRDAQVVQTLREKYEDFTELEPKIAEMISSRRVDIFNPNKLEIAYLMAKGLKAHEDAIAKANGEAPKTPTTPRANKDEEKLKAFTETAGNQTSEGDEEYGKKVQKAKTSGNSDDWVDVIASRLNI